MGVTGLCGMVSPQAAEGSAAYLYLRDGQDRVETTEERILKFYLESDSEPTVLPGSGTGLVIRWPVWGLRVSGSGPIELSIAIQSRGHQESRLELRVDGTSWGTLYRKRFLDPDEDLVALELEMNVPRGYWGELVDAAEAGIYDFNDYDLLISLRRVAGRDCKMTARVSGDLSGDFHGDVAFFNLFEEGRGVANELASGTAADEGMHEILQETMGGAGDMLEFLDAQGIELGPDAREALEQAETTSARSELEEWEKEILNSGDNNFGLSLTDVKFSDSAPGGLGGLGAALEAFGGFSLGLSGRIGNPQTESTVDVTSVRMTPGARDANFEGVKFLWEDGLPGWVHLGTGNYDDAPGVLYGNIDARLRSEKEYDGRYLWINVDANFKARQGFQSCSE